jgi:molecular chaperone DnaK
MARIGIDLGTTFSVVAYYDVDARRVEVIPDAETAQLTVPSAVYYPESGDPIVGWTALNKAAEAPDRLVRWIKMSMGTDFKKQIGDQEYTPEDVSAEILKKLKQNAEIYLGEEVEGVVITVPAYFGDAQRHATQQAAELVGLNVVRLLAEPSAAALAYVVEANTDLSGEKNVLVSDLGGGTYDVTLLQTQPVEDEEGQMTLNIRIVCKDGSQELGGKLWDDALEDYVVEQCIAQGHTDDPKAEPRLAFGLRDRVIQGKHTLSASDTTQIVCDMGNTQEITREKFEELTASRVLEAEAKLRSVLKQAEDKHGISLQEIDPILQVGGSSKMPMIAKMIENVTGQTPQTHRNVDLLVAIGAAYDVCIASSMEEGEPIKTRSGGLEIHTPPVDIGKAVGVKAFRGLTDDAFNAIVIEDGSATGKEFVREDLVTRDDNQPGIQFDIFEGDSEDLELCVQIGTVTLTLPPNEPKGTPVKVTLKYNDSGIIVGSGVCFTTEGAKEVPIEIDHTKRAQV